MPVQNYKDLEVWKKGIEPVDFIYKATSTFPTEEKYGLAQHMQKTAVSIPSNIAEGFLREHVKEYKRFLHISLGSCGELETQVIIAKRRKYIESDVYEQLEDMLDHECRMLMSLMKKVAG